MKRFFGALLAVVMLLATVNVSFAATGSVTYNTGTRHEVCEELSAQAEAYYVGEYAYDVISALESDASDPYRSEMFNALHDMMEDTMTDSVTYGDLPDSWKYTDAEGGNKGTMLFYSDTESESFNREHVWPKSRGSFFQRYAGADLHHLRPTNSDVNSKRSNYTMGNVRENYSSYTTKEYNGKTVLYYIGAQDIVEVNDNIKGDVARILLYVYVRWEQPNLYKNVATSELPAFDPDDDANNGKKVIESKETLLEWMEIDPVDTWEMSRNDQCENVQGNRNVFIDYPEYAWLLFEENVPDNYTTPSGEGDPSPKFSVTAVSENESFGTVSSKGYTVTAVPKEGYYVSGATVDPKDAATVTVNGNTIRLKNVTKACTVTVSFAKKPIASVAYLDALQGNSTVTVYLNEAYTLPDADDVTVDGVDYAFVGWSDSEIKEPTDQFPKVQYPGTSVVAVKDTSYYAVYRYGEEGESRAEWVQLIDGEGFKPDTEYAFVSIPYGSTDHKLLGNEVISKNYWNGVTFTDFDGTFEDGTVTAEAVDASCIFTATELKSGGFALQNNESGKYLALNSVQSSGKAYCKFDVDCTSVTSTLTLAIWRADISDNRASVAADAYPNYRLCFAYDYNDWACYNADASSAQVYADCYILQHGGGRTYYYTTGKATLPEPPEFLLGDADLNGIVNAADAAVILRAVVDLAQPEEAALLAADVDQDGAVTSQDAARILRAIVGMGTL